ncbi:glycosyltransferase [Desulfonatronovibrio magnus]|uniref:glycosyltransferase n=1 Tax=Desulfonatronovibrio magnus TaxID=698827 RepID=UPI0005EB4AB6|nr:glycosyltransferase [Desulfonatronovibrio magnus]
MKDCTRMDMHVHSKYSTKPAQWILKKLGCSESYTEPEFIYSRLKEKGMDLVTITDHNCIDACLEIANLDDTFISEEITTYLPEDKCKLHVLAYDISEAQHREIQKVRPNVHELVNYLLQENIVHGLAHPMFSTNGKLDYDNFEMLLLLFKIFEINGARDASLNTGLEYILNHLCPKDFEYLENKHGFKAKSVRPWEKGFIGGSDDHSSLNIGRMFTEVPGAHIKDTFLEGINNGHAKAMGTASTPKTLAHNLYAIGYQFCKKKFNLEKYIGRDSFLQFMDKSLHPWQIRPRSMINSFITFLNSKRKFRPGHGNRELHQLLSHETEHLIRTDPEIKKMVRSSVNPHEHMGAKWFRFASKASNKVLSHSAEQLLRQASSSGFMSAFQTLGSAGSLYSMLAPYFVSYSMFNHDRKLSSEFLTQYNHNKNITFLQKDIKVAHFTDTFYEVNGVALTLQQQADLASRSDKELTIITCKPEHRYMPERPNVKNFDPIGVFELPEYPEIRLFYPPFLEMLDFCFDQKITHIHTATPGPIGMAALAVSKLLHLPIFGTYHTSLPQYTGYLTGDYALEAVMWKYMVWYYNQLDTVFAPSKSTVRELQAKGVRQEKLKVYPRGVDINRFSPKKRNGFFDKNFGITDKIKLLYVGRVSKEKNLHILEQAFVELSKISRDIHLIIIGDGPYRFEMEYKLKDLPVTFTGYLSGEDLTQAYASSDLFVFPSTTDTFGNVVLEAQASGIPAIVVNEGGPLENILDNKTGLIIQADDSQALKDAVHALVNNPARLKQMGHQARVYMEGRSFEKAFDQTWEMYARSA